jgi:ubiquinone/menaquinone biosynthesis C-methylase UbiE
VNKAHLEYCGGPEWADTVKRYVIPWVTGGIDLGTHLLEVGPGPGLTTDVLRAMVPKLTAVEIDEDLAAALEQRMAGTNVVTVNADATALPFDDNHFDSAICLTMLHHVPDAATQDQLFRELARVVKPRGPIIGSDSLHTPELRDFHEGDTYVPVPPEGLAERLAGLGMTDVEVETNRFSLKFVARAT